jgi:hypothetical protein
MFVVTILTEYVSVDKKLLAEILNEVGELKKLANKKQATVCLVSEREQK